MRTWSSARWPSGRRWRRRTDARACEERHNARSFPACVRFSSTVSVQFLFVRPYYFIAVFFVQCSHASISGFLLVFVFSTERNSKSLSLDSPPLGYCLINCFDPTSCTFLLTTCPPLNILAPKSRQDLLRMRLHIFVVVCAFLLQKYISPLPFQFISSLSPCVRGGLRVFLSFVASRCTTLFFPVICDLLPEQYNRSIASKSVRA